MRTLSVYLLTCALVASLILGAYAVRAGHDTSHQNCRQIELLKTSVRQSLVRGRQSLPTIAYYRHHPAELQRQLRLIDHELGLFARRKC